MPRGRAEKLPDKIEAAVVARLTEGEFNEKEVQRAIDRASGPQLRKAAREALENGGNAAKVVSGWKPRLERPKLSEEQKIARRVGKMTPEAQAAFRKEMGW